MARRPIDDINLDTLPPVWLAPEVIEKLEGGRETVAGVITDSRDPDNTVAFVPARQMELARADIANLQALVQEKEAMLAFYKGLALGRLSLLVYARQEMKHWKPSTQAQMDAKDRILERLNRTMDGAMPGELDNVPRT